MTSKEVEKFEKPESAVKRTSVHPKRPLCVAMTEEPTCVGGRPSQWMQIVQCDSEPHNWRAIACENPRSGISLHALFFVCHAFTEAQALELLQGRTIHTVLALGVTTFRAIFDNCLGSRMRAENRYCIQARHHLLAE